MHHHIETTNIFEIATILDVLKHAIMVSLFVIVMMLLIEFLTVQTKGQWSKPFRKSTGLQILFSAIMGIIPGCLGTYTIVSMYTHKILRFSALVTVMIATFGDEAFYMFALIPDTAFKILLMYIILYILIYTNYDCIQNNVCYWFKKDRNLFAPNSLT